MCPLPPLTVQVTNTGNVTSDYVALAFVSGEYGPKPYPIKTLASYSRLKAISPTSKALAKLAWTVGNIARHDENGNTVLYPGTYTVKFDEPTKASFNFTLEGKAEVLDKWPAPKKDPRQGKKRL